ncbi:unnamed protein product [Ectocarpus sp. CCAP 1310/34]|nr:unnamed protein product [Ectocarpus sp. CCAP 1310/34]
MELTGKMHACTGCSMSKAFKKGIAHETKCRSDKKLGRVFVDLGGRKDVASVGGNHYPMIVKDDFTRRTWIYFLKSKSDAASAFRSFLASVLADGIPSLVEIVRSDNGGEVVRGEFASVCNELLIKQEFTPAYSPQYNGVAERGGSDRLSCCRRVRLAFLSVLRETTRVTVIRVLTSVGTIQETRNVTWEALPSQLPPPQPSLLPIEVAEEGGEERPETGEAESAGPGGQEVESESQEGLDEELVEPGGQEVESESFSPATHVPYNRLARHELANYNTAANENVEVREGRTRAQTRAVNHQIVSGLMANLGPISASEIIEALLVEQRASDTMELPRELIQDVETEPGSYREARQSKHAVIWDKAMSAQFEGLLRAGTFALAAKIVKAKAGLVAKGFKQKYGVDYLETFSPTANAASIRLLVALTCKYDLEFLHFDIEQAFVQSELDHEVFMKLPPGCESMSGKVVRFDKSLDGLRQACRTFLKRFVSDLKRISVEQSLSDPCVLRFMMRNEVMGVIAIHVDDFLCGGIESLAKIVVQALGDSFHTKNFGEVKFFHGCACSRDREAGKIEMSQRARCATEHSTLTYKQDTMVDVSTLVYVDADFASRATDRRSVSGALVLVADCLVAWISRTQKCVTLSTTEAEYVAISDGVKEALFVNGMLEFLRPSGRIGKIQ